MIIAPRLPACSRLARPLPDSESASSRPWDDGGPLVFRRRVKAGAFSLYFGDEPIYHFDLEGRWQRAYLEALHYLKGLDAEVYEIDRVRVGPNLVLRRRKLSYGEAADLDARRMRSSCATTDWFRARRRSIPPA